MDHAQVEVSSLSIAAERSTHPNTASRGFTLVEMLLVVLIIAVLAGALVTNLSGRSEEARVATAKSDISAALSTALDLYEHDLGRYPTEEEGLQALVEDPSDPAWKGPYLKTGLRPDPWGQSYVYQRDPEYPTRYRLSSVGPDKQAGTEDDITSQ